MAVPERHLARALELAARGRYKTAPNPRVGAVLVQDGLVVGEGWHRRLGGPHAEVEALLQAGEAARGATLYVNLEPCCHHGRTPPCTEALLAAGVARVVACHRDPDPRVGGQGFARLRAAGVEVTLADGPLVDRAVALNLPFLVPALLGRPAVTLKWAMSLDGRIASAAGESQWISSREGRRWALALREEHDAILVGIGTALADDPRLDRRLGLAEGPNTRVVLDRRLRLPATARLFTVPGPVLLYTEATAPAGPLEERGATVIRLATVEPVAVLADLLARGVRSVLVEGGAGILAAFAAAHCWDSVAVDCAPVLLGGATAPGPLAGPGFALAAAPRLDRLDVRRQGPDMILSGHREGRIADLRARLDAV